MILILLKDIKTTLRIYKDLRMTLMLNWLKLA